MPRPPRVEIPGAFYHVGARGNDRQPIFDDELRALWLALVARAARAYDWTVFAYALMTNHFHLVIQLGDGGLSDGMFALNNPFARASNARFGRINHAFGQRFWSRHVADERHLTALIPYVLWNPARKRVGQHPRDNAWTSYRASVALDHAPPCLAVSELLQLYGPNPRAAVTAFDRHVSESHGRCQAP
jgi:REP element-mobilizing transposase RayT